MSNRKKRTGAGTTVPVAKTMCLASFSLEKRVNVAILLDNIWGIGHINLFQI
jgi:hypothetical protein